MTTATRRLVGSISIAMIIAACASAPAAEHELGKASATEPPESETTQAADNFNENRVFGDVIEVSEFAFDAVPSASDRTEADIFLAALSETIEQRGWRDIDVALADGYRLDMADEVHFVNEEFLSDGRVADPERPEYLIYLDKPIRGEEGEPTGETRGERVLVGAMFLNDTLQGRGPQFGGSETIWHYHRFDGGGCLQDGLNLGRVRVPRDGTCDVGVPAQRSAEMIHAWLFENPAGRWSSSMALDRVNLGFEDTDPEGIEVARVRAEADIGIRAGDNFFDQTSYVANKGTVSFGVFNAGILAHRLRLDGDEDFSLTVTGNAQTSVDRSTLAPGSYTIFCEIPGHREAGMEAEIFVQNQG